MIFYKSLSNNETVMKNPEMLRFVPEHRKTKKMCKHVAEKSPYLLRYVPDRYKTQHKCVIKVF